MKNDSATLHLSRAANYFVLLYYYTLAKSQYLLLPFQRPKVSLVPTKNFDIRISGLDGIVKYHLIRFEIQ